LDRKLNDLGVQVVKINPTYTSQRCFFCGWTRKSNRLKKQFKCKSCGHTDDADLNASKNIALDLPAISKVERSKQLNRKGFYWL
jgi:transposase